MKRFFVNPKTGLVRSGWVIAVYLLATAAIAAPLGLLVSQVFHVSLRNIALDDWKNALQTVPQLAAAIGATLLCVGAFKEKSGLESKAALRHTLAGLTAGGLTLALVVLVPVLLGEGGTLVPFRDEPSAIVTSGVVQLFAIGAGSVSEELATRGVMFHALARGTHWLVSLVATSLLFGLAHLANPNATIFAAANVALVGVLFGLLTLRYSLWASIGFHVAWNWFEGFVFGQPVSGFKPGAALISASVEGAQTFWSGGDFGPEASGFTTVVLSALVVVAFLKFRERP